MTDVTFAKIDEMEAIYGGGMRRARAELGVTAFGMQVMTYPPNWDGYPDHTHAGGPGEPGEEEVYIPISGSATLIAGDETFDLVPGVMVRVGPAQSRRIIPGGEGIRLIALGGVVGAHTPMAWTELGGPAPR